MPSLIFQLLLSAQLPVASKLWADIILPSALSSFCRRRIRCDANARDHMVHMNMHGNDWQGRHRSAATFLASIMMRGKIIWWMVGSIPHSSMTACTSRSRSHSHPGAERVNARRRGRPPLPCTRPGKRRGTRQGNGSWLAKATRRASPKPGILRPCSRRGRRKQVGYG